MLVASTSLLSGACLLYTSLVVDDYAHHPTELRATLTTAKEMGYKRLIAVHQPFTYSRTKMPVSYTHLCGGIAAYS